LLASVYHLPFEDNSFDLVIGCELLEHLEETYNAIEEIKRVSNFYCLFSVPNEPLWRILNLCRLAYIENLGSTPGHIQHWTKKEFIRVIQYHFKIYKIISIYPWIMVLCKET